MGFDSSIILYHLSSLFPLILRIPFITLSLCDISDITDLRGRVIKGIKGDREASLEGLIAPSRFWR